MARNTDIRKLKTIIDFQCHIIEQILGEVTKDEQISSSSRYNDFIPIKYNSPDGHSTRSRKPPYWDFVENRKRSDCDSGIIKIHDEILTILSARNLPFPVFNTP